MPDAKNPSTPASVPSPACIVCGVGGAVIQLYHCRCCRRRFCDDCAYRSRMGLFCSAECARRFLLGDSDEEDEEGGEEE